MADKCITELYPHRATNNELISYPSEDLVVIELQKRLSKITTQLRQLETKIDNILNE